MILKYHKGQPNLHIIRYRAGEIAAEGAGVNFWYWPWNTTIATVPLATQEAPFIFNEFTANYQEVAIQGVLTYRLGTTSDHCGTPRLHHRNGYGPLHDRRSRQIGAASR